MNATIAFCSLCGLRLDAPDDVCRPCRDAEALRSAHIVDYSPPPSTIQVFFQCAMCGAPQRTEHDVCLHCCGAEAMPGRCGLEAGHEGEHEPPAVASPAWDDGVEYHDRSPDCEWCGGRGCSTCDAPGYAGVERDPW